ncbi:MAG: hypothetical protein DHS20C19_11300 [Acidimicrobiales bacterium]|nr:MAG: hypothetical protein DHS20C19_11300 [Acidimicrobiales bacterium]
MKKLLLLAGVLGLLALIIKKRSTDRTDWQDLTATEARDKLNDRFPDRMPADTRDMVTDKIVTKMREKGVLADDPIEGVDLTDTIVLDDAAKDVDATT